MENGQPQILQSAQLAELLGREGSNGIDPEDYSEETQPAGARERRTQLLQDVLATCQYLWQSGSGELDLTAESLGNGSRDRAWRLPFGDAKILDFFLGALTVDGLRHQLQIHALRLIGNSCADTDENRARVVQGNFLPAIIRRLQDDVLVSYAIPVLYNILVDYEPAQVAASDAQLSSHLIGLFSSRNIPNLPLLVPFICKILALLVAHDCEAANASPDTVDVLLQVANSPWKKENVEEFTSLLAVIVAYLSKENAQTRLVASPNFNLFLAAFEHAQGFDIHAVQSEDPDTAAQLTQLRIALLNMLADLSANEAFATYHPLTSATVQTLLAWLSGSNASAACLALGNLSRSDEVSSGLVQTYGAHRPLVALLSNSATTDSQVLHGAMSFLKNLAIPNHNKSLLGELLSPGCVPRIFIMDTMPQVHFAAVSLTRLLLVNCPDNVKRICAPLVQQSPTAEGLQTSVHGLLSLFNRSDAEPTRLEAARAVAALCRVLHSTPVLPVLLPGWDPLKESFVYEKGTPVSPQDKGFDDANLLNERRELFYRQHDVSKPLGFLISQKKWPILRSEAWFVFALMSRSKDGAGVVLNVLSDTIASTSLVEAVTGQQTLPDASSPDDKNLALIAGAGGNPDQPSVQLEPQQVDPTQKANMDRVDRENAVVLCTELLKYRGTEMSQAQHALLQDLVLQGTRHIASHSSQDLHEITEPSIKTEP